MTDKLICPFCGEPLYVDDDGEYLTCENFHCDASIYMQAETWKQIIAWKQSAAVLQKKLDKAMAVIDEIMLIVEEQRYAPNSTVFTPSSSDFRTIDMLITDFRKEIEDIKE